MNCRLSEIAFDSQFSTENNLESTQLALISTTRMQKTYVVAAQQNEQEKNSAINFQLGS